MEISEFEVNRLYEVLDKDAKSGGYNLNPDVTLTKELVHGLIVNINRYGYMACPCRLASGKKKEDLDIICPCDYRDPDLFDYDTCYCGLYVSNDVVNKIITIGPIPERRGKKEKKVKAKSESDKTKKSSYPVWRCNVCGYLCARNNPPEVCPVCKSKRDRFEIFM